MGHTERKQQTIFWRWNSRVKNLPSLKEPQGLSWGLPGGPGFPGGKAGTEKVPMPVVTWLTEAGGTEGGPSPVGTGLLYP